LFCAIILFARRLVEAVNSHTIVAKKTFAKGRECR
jgi:hypothetical protein